MERLLEWPSEQGNSRTRREIIAWWEARRFRFNLYVGIIGIVTWFLVLIAGSAAVKPGVDFEEPIAMIIGPFVYGVLANACYTFGWIVDIVSYHGMPRIRLFKVGIIFSAILTALPGLWAVVAWLATLITGRKLD
ncbi:MAG TPA: hypothetical protein VHX36_07015 [Candidatus Acidoferrales bacterium]|jgi:hypothetical protein|nr:hypothetical protein [Candidatus Acidoferrales bacterium]